ncbi:MAG: helix-turn-helix domain-containing protein [Bacteroidetes bacterium]|nr:helix-turn-helix domain-containing protein [Bacteroidota bacterium]
MYSELYEKSGSEIIRELGGQYGNYRKRMGFTQKEVSEKSGLSVFTISSFENGSSTGITLASFIKLLRAIDNLEEIEKLLPELPVSPRELFKKQHSSTTLTNRKNSK